jgi:hypothetical protein
VSAIAWFEIPAGETDRAQKFYGDLLGWTFEPFGPDYQVAGDAGGAVHSANGRSAILVYFGVDDIDAAAAKVNDLGGTADDIQHIPDTGRYTTCKDTEGNAFGLYQRS